MAQPSKHTNKGKAMKEIVEKLVEKNPYVEENPLYLILEVWDVEGLRLYPNQREMILKGEVSTPEGIVRQLRRTKELARREKPSKNNKPTLAGSNRDASDKGKRRTPVRA